LHAAARDIIAPWNTPLTAAGRSLVLYSLVVAALALMAMLLRMWSARREVSSRYRPTIYAGVGVLAVAFLSYVLLTVAFLVGYDRHASAFVPNDAAIWSWAPRYMDWSVSVPLLVVELLAVSALLGRRATWARGIGVAAAFLMILLGYLGGVVIDEGTSFVALLTFGTISAVFFAVLYVVVIGTVVISAPVLPAAARPAYRGAMVLLLVVWFAYPIVFGFQGIASGPAWPVTAHLVLSAADIVAKTGYSLLILRVAVLRTAADVAGGVDVHPEAIWVDQHRQSDPVLPPTFTPQPAELPTPPEVVQRRSRGLSPR
jgi:bacteriorhodopsin